MAKNPTGSPVSDGGRGLKHPHSRSDRAGYLGSPVSDGGRGLKPAQLGVADSMQCRFARQRWRAWIETPASASRLFGWWHPPLTDDRV